MEIQRSPVTLEQRMEHLNKNTVDTGLNNKPFPWTIVIVSLIAGASFCVMIIYYQQKKKEKKVAQS